MDRIGLRSFPAAALAAALLSLPVFASEESQCAAVLSADEAQHLKACIARGAQCTDYWPGYPDDLADCERTRKWLAKAMKSPEPMRSEIFGAPATAAKPAAGVPAWKSLPRSQDASAPRAVGRVAAASASDYAGASSNLDPSQSKAAGVNFWLGSVPQMIGLAVSGEVPPVHPEPARSTGTASAAGSRAPPPAVTMESLINRASEKGRPVATPNLDMLILRLYAKQL